MYVSSNGHLTFGSAAPLPVNGVFDFVFLPRIAPFSTDLDPSSAEGDGGVYVFFPPGRVRITWLRVPPAGRHGEATTMQVTLFTTGRINVAYGEVAAAPGILGVAPVGEGTELRLLDFSEDVPVRPVRALLVEELGGSEVDETAVARRFLEVFQDTYDTIVLWTDFPIDLGGAAAFFVPVRNDIEGLGRRIFDRSAEFGSAGRLSGVIQMGELAAYASDPDSPSESRASAMTLLGHEVGHRWLSFIRFRDAEGELSDELLDPTLKVHWSSNFNNDGSFMGGRSLLDLGDGTFRVVSRPGRYGRLDRYLMGLIAPEEVGEIFYIRPTGRLGNRIVADRVDLELADILAAEGPRNPSYVASQRNFHHAFVLLTEEGKLPGENALRKLEGFRQRWGTFFPTANGGHAEVDTVLLPKN